MFHFRCIVVGFCIIYPPCVQLPILGVFPCVPPPPIQSIWIWDFFQIISVYWWISPQPINFPYLGRFSIFLLGAFMMRSAIYFISLDHLLKCIYHFFHDIFQSMKHDIYVYLVFQNLISILSYDIYWHCLLYTLI